jgi:RNA polymerase sigma-70 factor, ECF subfamily
MDSHDLDAPVLRRVARGDRRALEELAVRYEGPLVGLATGLMGGRADLARDAVQDAWVRVIRHAAGFRGQSTVKTWLYRIVINRCKDLREKLARDRGGAGYRHDYGAGERFDEAPELEPPMRASGTERAAALHAALAGLPGGSRLIVLLCYHQGLTHEQAAEVLDIPTGTLKSRLNAALKELRRSLASEGPSEGEKRS